MTANKPYDPVLEELTQRYLADLRKHLRLEEHYYAFTTCVAVSRVADNKGEIVIIRDVPNG